MVEARPFLAQYSLNMDAGLVWQPNVIGCLNSIVAASTAPAAAPVLPSLGATGPSAAVTTIVFQVTNYES